MWPNGWKLRRSISFGPLDEPTFGDCLRKANSTDCNWACVSTTLPPQNSRRWTAKDFLTSSCVRRSRCRKIQADPRGLEVALAKLGVAGAHAVYIGDRPEVDGVAAQRAAYPLSA
jgi:hypothetical protein